MQRLDTALASVQEGRSTAEHPVEAALAEVEDLLSYCNDIIGTGVCLDPTCAQTDTWHLCAAQTLNTVLGPSSRPGNEV
jgi:hypothetical protein